jgi:uncharacterized protein DUF1990
MLTRLTTTLRWPAGIVMTAWSYLWRTTVVHRREVAGAWPEDGPPPVAPDIERAGIQRPEDGVGPLFRRRYRGRIHDAHQRAEPLMSEIQADPNRVAPGGLAHFQKLVGDEGIMRTGDEFVVRMPAPWDGPIRVVEVTPRSFRFATLHGHLEAGQIEWRVDDDTDGALVFEIESWARGGDRLSYVMHDRVPMAKEVQLHMWTRVLERVAARVDGELSEGIDIETRRVELPPD